jgi:hypothetical protein
VLTPIATDDPTAALRRTRAGKVPEAGRTTTAHDLLDGFAALTLAAAAAAGRRHHRAA